MTSDVHVMVQAINTQDKSTDSFTVLPVEDLGTDHVVAVYRQPYTGWSFKCSFLDGLPPVSSVINNCNITLFITLLLINTLRH